MGNLGVGHGFVRPLPGGAVARCGGPGLCAECKEELVNMTRAVKELYYWQVRGPEATNFTAILYTLMQKGSGGNRERLGMGFPWELEAWRQWLASPRADTFFTRYGLGTLAPRAGDHENKKQDDRETAGG